ncbi:MAG: AAA family ATPase [Clostridiales bacterium]|nr:AAA family ATPase [Clostridiales bacterium]
MRLTNLNISNFGLFHNKKIELSPGLNLIHGENEAGKSTVHSFVNGMLFGNEKSRGRPGPNDMYDKYQPWDRPGSYDGSLEFEVNDNKYHIYRNFSKNSKDTVLTHVNTGREMGSSSEELQELFGGLTKAGYEGTISIGQLSAKTEAELAYLVQNHIANLTMARSQEIDVKKALEYLNEKYKEYDLKSLKQEIDYLQDKIAQGESAEESIKDLTRQLSDIQAQEEKLMMEKNNLIASKYLAQEELHRQFMRLPVIKTKYSYFLDRNNHKVQLEGKIEGVKSQVERISDDSRDPNRKNKQSLAELKDDMESITKNKEQYNQLAREKYEYKSHKEDEIALAKKRNLNITSPFFVIGLITSLVSYNSSDLLFRAGISLTIIGLIIFTVLSLITNNKKAAFEMEYGYLDKELETVKKKYYLP